MVKNDIYFWRGACVLSFSLVLQYFISPILYAQLTKDWHFLSWHMYLRLIYLYCVCCTLYEWMGCIGNIAVGIVSSCCPCIVYIHVLFLFWFLYLVCYSSSCVLYVVLALILHVVLALALCKISLLLYSVSCSCSCIMYNVLALVCCMLFLLM